MFSNAFTAACLAGAALSLDLNTQGDSNNNGKSVTDTNTEWKDANICITYGEDNSCSDSCGSCDSHNKCDDDYPCCDPSSENPRSTEVTYTSIVAEIDNISSLVTTFFGSDDVTLTGTSSYEILGLCDYATIKQHISLTLTHVGTINFGDVMEAFFAFVDDDDVLNGYVATYTESNDRFTWERFTQATQTVPTLTVTSDFVDFATAGLTKVLDEFFEDGDQQVTATLTTGDDGYRLDVAGTSVSSDDSSVTFKVVQEGDNDDLAIIAGGKSLTVTMGVVYTDADASTTTGVQVTDAEINFGAQIGTPYDDPSNCDPCHNDCLSCAHVL